MTRRELGLFLLVLCGGAGLRLWNVAYSAVEHFDEGVYASNLWFGAPDYAYPLRHLYAPPLLPALIEAGMIAGLPANFAALLPIFLAGCATIAAVWWFGRTWFGPPVGLSAAALCALSDFHIAYSAAALTDVLLGLWLVLAVQTIGLSLSSGDLRWAVAGGVLTGLAWWTKYNGWLPLAIEAAALVVLWFFQRPSARQLRMWLACFIVTAIVAAIIWSPYYLSLQAYGGYGPIAANHARYVVGASGWLASAGRQIANQYAIGLGWGTLGLILAWFLPSLVAPRRLREALWLFGSSAISVLGVSLVTGLFPVAVGAAAGIARMLWAVQSASRLDDAWQRRLVGASLVFAWWGGMLVATPLYTPYPRLVLPLTIAAWLAASMNWDEPLLDKPQPGSMRPGSVWGCLLWPAVLAGWVVLSANIPHEDHLAGFGNRRGLASIARQIRATSKPGQTRVIYVFGEPAMLFQLRAAGEEIVIPIQEVPTASPAQGEQPVPMLLVAGPHAFRDPGFQSQLAAASERWRLEAAFNYEPSHIVWLDLNDPRRSPQETSDLDRVRMYRFEP